MYLGTINNTPRWRKFIWIFFVLVIGFCVFIFDYALSRVTIKIFPKNVTQSFATGLTIDASTQAANIDRMIFPARIISREVSIASNIPTTGTKETLGFASGEVTIENKRNQEVTLPKGFKLIYGSGPVEGETWKDKIIFALDNDIAIPANGTLKTPITAINRGARGNVNAGAFYFASMSQTNRQLILPRADKAFSGGLTIEKLVVQEDIDRGRDELLKKAKADAVSNVINTLTDDQTCIEELTFVDIAEYTADKKPGEFVDSFGGKLSGTARVLIYSPVEIKNALKKKLADKYGTFELLSIDDASFKLEMKSFDLAAAKAEVEASLSGTFAPKFSSELFEKKPLIGFNTNAIRQYYAPNPAIDHVDISFFPAWRSTVPSLEDHVFVEIVK